MRRPGPGAITMSPTGSSTSSSIVPRARSEPPCGSMRFSSQADAAGADLPCSRPFFLLVFLHRLPREPERLDSRGHSAVHRHLTQHLAYLFAGAAVGERAPDVGLELVRPVSAAARRIRRRALPCARRVPCPTVLSTLLDPFG